MSVHNDGVIVELALHYCLYDSERINSCQTMTTFVLKRTMPYNDHVRMFAIPIFRSYLPLHEHRTENKTLTFY